MNNNIKIGQKYFYVSEFGNVLSYVWINDNINEGHAAMNNVFLDENNALSMRNIFFVAAKELQEGERNGTDS